MKTNQIIILPNKILHICIHYFLYVKDISNYLNLLNIIMCVWFDCNKVIILVIVQKKLVTNNFLFWVLNLGLLKFLLRIKQYRDDENVRKLMKCMWSLFQ